MGKPVKKRFDLQVTAAGETVTKSFELDKNIRYVNGLLLSSDRDDMLYYRGAQRIEINKEEFFPDNYESKLLMSGINVPPKQRYYELDKVNTGNGTIRVIYTDNENALTQFEPYRVSLYVEGEIEE